MESTTETPNDLSGQLLIAMPGMGDPRFEKSVVFLCAHSAEGAMGLIVNKPTSDLALDDLLDQLDIDKGEGSRGIGVFFGGPVETGRGFVLHSRDYHGSPSTLQVDEAFSMTATRDILEDIARGLGPAQSLAALGYAGWAPGQLEGELQQNAWLTVDADEAIVFSADIGGKWSAALAKLGIDPLLLSAEGGRA
ncbi:YqgE/AlgH family protein [Aliiroseovarius sp.]|uniref:YqgE/AlgH family protein n=1 Tax=Aliiroseovarius sp. TaxID=1872442 RepID=UPI003BA8AEBA